MGEWSKPAAIVAAALAHSRHANTGGTNFLREDGGDGSPAPEPKFVRASRASNGVSPDRKVAVRQGIARSRGHVAPARSLC